MSGIETTSKISSAAPQNKCAWQAIALCVTLLTFLSPSYAQIDELSTARKALRDGLWNVARMHAGNVITNDAAKLVILESVITTLLAELGAKL
ncbi:MAG: hypothetical protein J6R80_03110, partial [Kiritimatiellae bacterium]|nr:hypothetical protein [Kiritimatiellia bacterium]